MLSLFRGSIPSSSVISYHLNVLEAQSKIIDIAQDALKNITVFLDTTPFHPVDPHWPDQPADKGTLVINDKTFNVVDCKILGVHKETKEIKETTEISKNEKNDWHFVVGHTIDNQENNAPEFFLDSEVAAKVDEIFRSQISLHHTSCHVAAFALNLALKDFWTKEVAPKDKDSLGSPNFDQLAMEKSVIFSDRSEDTYRFGKSLKKMGFQLPKLVENVTSVESKVNGLLRDWLEQESKVDIMASGPHLDDRRTWQCDLDVGKAGLPCGGTHVPSLLFIKDMKYSLKFFDDAATKECKLLAVTKASANTDAGDKDTSDVADIKVANRKLSA